MNDPLARSMSGAGRPHRAACAPRQPGRILLAAGTAAVLAGAALPMLMPATALADSARPDALAARTPPLVAYGDAQSILPDIALKTALSGLPRCGQGKVPREPRFTTALADANRLFKGAAAKGKRALDAAKYSGTSGRAEVFAAAAATARAPAAGLAALLDADRHARHDPMLFINASVFLTELGHPADALAFIDHAHEMGRIKGTPLGLPGIAVEANDRGFALLGMHNYAAALRALNTATTTGGRLLSEANFNRAEALACLGKGELAFHALLAGAYRQNYELAVVPGTTGQSTLEQPSLTELGFTKPDGPLDTLPTLKYPTSQSVATSANAGFAKLGNFVLGEITALDSTLSQQVTQLGRHLLHASPLTRQRTYAIMALIGQLPANPAVRKAFNATTRAQEEIDNFESQFGGTNPPLPCGHHGTWLSLIQAWDTTIRKYVAIDGKYRAPLVANLSTPLAHQLELTGVRINDDFELLLLINDVRNWTALEGKCQQQGTMPPPPDKDATPADPGQCPPILAPTHKLVLKIPNFVDVKVNCDSVEATVEGEGLVAPFASADHNAHGETTIFAGAKAGVDIGPFGGGELQEGFYIKSGPSGIEDWGVRISPSASAGAGPVLIEYGSSVDISLAGSIGYIPTAFGIN